MQNNGNFHANGKLRRFQVFRLKLCKLWRFQEFHGKSANWTDFKQFKCNWSWLNREMSTKSTILRLLSHYDQLILVTHSLRVCTIFLHLLTTITMTTLFIEMVHHHYNGEQTTLDGHRSTRKIDYKIKTFINTAIAMNKNSRHSIKAI